MGIELGNINRTLLLDTLRTLLDEDEYQILLVRITTTNLQTRVQGTYGSSFPTSIGVPQVI